MRVSRLLPVALLLSLCLAPSLRADEKGKKGEDRPAVKATDADVEKLVREVTRRVLEELRGDKKAAPKKGEPDKKAPVKGGEPPKGETKSRVVRVDLSKLPPDLARQVEKFAERDDKDTKAPQKGKQEQKPKEKQGGDEKGKNKDKKKDKKDD